MDVMPCLDCGGLTQGSRCERCTRRRERVRTTASGRNTNQWQRLRERRKQLDGYHCVYCGATQDLTVDLDPRLQGNHRTATIADCVTACRSCNSCRGATPPARRGGPQSLCERLRDRRDDEHDQQCEH
jgi:5-methylcytosine-specific restriction endonuclease McrA